MRVIKELDDLKLVARVAEVLNVTQPAVSKQIAELENIVGVPIVSRDRNRLYLTPIGVRLAEHARRVLNQLDRAVFDIDAMATGVSGSVAIGAVSSVAPIVLPGAIALFKSSAPDAEVSLYEGHFVSLFPQLEAGTIDLLIARVWQANELPGVEQMVLLREPIVVVSGPDHPLARHGSVDWPDATDWPWILPQANSIARRAIDALFAEHGLLTPTNTIASLSLAVNLEILRADARARVVSSQFGARPFRAGRGRYPATGHAKLSLRGSLLLAQRPDGSQQHVETFPEMPEADVGTARNHSIRLRL